MIDQLWYTWTSTGLYPGIAGAQIRATSPGLTDVECERVRSLDRYLRYYLPSATASDIIPEQAPISLAFLHTGQEQILLIRQYTGKDGAGRSGAFFVHLLAGLPVTFSVQDAVSLWGSPLWNKHDILDDSNIMLPVLTLNDLYRYRNTKL